MVNGLTVGVAPPGTRVPPHVPVNESTVSPPLPVRPTRPPTRPRRKWADQPGRWWASPAERAPCPCAASPRSCSTIPVCPLTMSRTSSVQVPGRASTQKALVRNVQPEMLARVSAAVRIISRLVVPLGEVMKASICPRVGDGQRHHDVL